MQPLRVGLCGLGTVGGGVVQVLRQNSALLSAHAGRDIHLAAVASRTAKPDVDLGGAPFGTDVFELATSDQIDVIVEAIGGEDTATALIEAAIGAGKSVVTANKAVIAQAGNELLHAADEHGVTLAFEAAVAGGIPIIDALRQGLTANRINWVAGIINGTSNYILTAMAADGQSFDDALAVAQQLGYAEADPTFDVEGVDAAHKLTILAGLGFDMPFDFDAIYTEGIRHITSDDIRYARELGYRIKHLGIARRTHRGVEVRVHPALVPESHLLSGVDGVMNAVAVHADPVGTTLYYGPGAGAGATASAVVADIVQIARGASPPPVPTEPLQTLPITAVETAYYLRIPLLDRPGVMAGVTNTLSEQGISIEALIQREEAVQAGATTPWVPVVILTERTNESRMDKAIEAIAGLDGVAGDTVRIRVEGLGD